MQVLSDLQDRLQPFPTTLAMAVIEQELQASIGDVFSQLSAEPVAAASLGQVPYLVLLLVVASSVDTATAPVAAAVAVGAAYAPAPVAAAATVAGVVASTAIAAAAAVVTAAAAATVPAWKMVHNGSVMPC